MINVLISEDSETSSNLLVYILNTDPAIHVMGVVGNGEDAVTAVVNKKPDVVMMDVHMPKMNGFEATRRIMQMQPVPVIIISSTLVDPIAATTDALDAGAVAYIQHPYGIGHPDHAAGAAELLQVVKLMAEVKVVKRWARHAQAERPAASMPPVKSMPGDINLIAIGASTGGPIVLQAILAAIAPGLNVPVLIVQHIAAGFVHVLGELLRTTGLPVHIAMDGETALPGHVYIAPEDSHMGIDNRGRLRLGHTRPEHGLRPAVAYLFRSVAESYGSSAMGILLTGMGKDGAEELKLMKDKGAITIAQDEQSSVVHGMPGEAIRLKGAHHVLPPDSIAVLVNSILKKKNRN